MLWFHAKLILRIFVAARQTFGLGGPALRHLFLPPLVIAASRLLFALDHLFHPGFRKVGLRQPLFIIGHPRSGTTFLHRLLAETREFCVFETWEIMCPFLSGRSLWRRMFRRLAKRGRGTLLTKGRGHEMSLDKVDEEELLLLHVGNTQFLSCLTPLAFDDRDFDDLVFADSQPSGVRRATMRFLRGCFLRQIHDTGKAQVVAKMNYSGTRIRSFFEEFPDARIVYVVRSPLETIPSHLTLHKNIFDRMWGLHRIPPDRLQRYYHRRYRHNVEFYRYVEDLIQDGSLPEGQFLVLNYDDMRRDLAGAVCRLCQFAQLELSPELQRRIDEQSARQPSYQRNHHNLGLEEFGLSREQVVRDLDFVFDKYGFPR